MLPNAQRKSVGQVGQMNGGDTHHVGNSTTATGERLRRSRIALGMSQKELAIKAGISHGLLSELENGVSANGDYLPIVREAIRKQLATVLRNLADAAEGVA